MEKWPKDVVITALFTFALIGISYLIQISGLTIPNAVGLTCLLIATVFIQIGMMPFVKWTWKVYPFYLGIVYVAAFMGTRLKFDPNYWLIALVIPLGAFVLAGYNFVTDRVWEKKYTMGLIAFIILALLYKNAI